MRREAALLKWLRTQTTMPLPDLVVADFEQTLLDRDYLIARAAPGVFYSDISTLTHAQHDHVYFQLGTFLRQLHQITGTQYGYNGACPSMRPQATWQQAFKTMWQNLIQDVVACGLYNDEEAISLITLLDTYSAYFEQDLQPVLLHMGICKENVVVDRRGNVTGFLSFGTAMWGDPEIDFAVLDCCGIWASAFWEGYGRPRPNDLGSRTRRKFYILYEVQKNIPLAVGRYDDLEEAEQYKQTTMTIATNLASMEP